MEDEIKLITSLEILLQKYNIYKQNQDIERITDANNFLIIGEFNYNSSTKSFIINNPFLSYNLRQNFKDISCLTRSWRQTKKNEENLIKIGDIIKLGRVRLKIDAICIKDIYESSQITNNLKKTKIKLKHGETLQQNKLASNKFLNNNMNTNINFSQNESIFQELRNNDIRNTNKTQNVEKISFNSEKDSTNLPTCRVCYLVNSDEENPLISPCNCKGTMKYIHYKCLKHCIDSNLTKKMDDYHKYYIWKNYSCEICKEDYPKYFKIKEVIYPLIDLDISFSSYIKCDYGLYDDLKKKTTRKGILIIKINDDIDDDVITLGRSQNNKVKLKDISVSRSHCHIVKRKKKLFIVDKGSKFGTLLYVNRPLTVNLENSEETIISGKHWFSIKLEEETSFLSKLFSIKCCQGNVIKKNTDIDIDNLMINACIEPEKILYNDINDFKDEKKNEVFDDSYKDYILDLGNELYIHQPNESEGII